MNEAVAKTGGRNALLLALRPVSRLAETEHQLCMDILKIHEAPQNRTFSLDLQHAAEMTSSEALHLRSVGAVNATEAVAECIFALPARTFDGILFKREVLHNFGRGDRPAFEDGMLEDLLAIVQEREMSPAAGDQAKAA